MAGTGVWCIQPASSAPALAGSHLVFLSRSQGRLLRLVCSAATNGPGSSQNGSVLNVGTGQQGSVENPGIPKKKKYVVKGNLGDEPYRILPHVGKFYLDELDVIHLLSSPGLVPFDPSNYNAAAYVWKKIGKIPEERRIRLLQLLKLQPSVVSSAWRVVGNRYRSRHLFTEDAFSLLSAHKSEEPAVWHGTIAGDSWPWSWLKDVTLELFTCKENVFCGRLTCNGAFGGIISRYTPLYFKAKPVGFVPGTNDECDLALDFSGDQMELAGLLPVSFQRPGKITWPLKEFVVYVRAVGPDVLAGQLWQNSPAEHGHGQRSLVHVILVHKN